MKSNGKLRKVTRGSLGDEDDNVKVLIVAAKGKESSGIKGKKRKRNKGEIIEEVITKAMKTVTDGMRRCFWKWKKGK